MYDMKCCQLMITKRIMKICKWKAICWQHHYATFPAIIATHC